MATVCPVLAFITAGDQPDILICNVASDCVIRVSSTLLIYGARNIAAASPSTVRPASPNIIADFFEVGLGVFLVFTGISPSPVQSDEFVQ